jgi:IS5 family transposase
MKFTLRAMKTCPSAQPLGFFDVEPRVQWLEAKGNPLSRLAEWVKTTDSAGYADSAYRSAEAEAMLAQKQPRKLSGERVYRNRPLSDEQKESNRQKSKIRARIEHIFGYMSQAMKGFYLRYIGRRRNAAAIGLINLIYNLARYEQIVRLKLLPRTAA